MGMGQMIVLVGVIVGSLLTVPSASTAEDGPTAAVIEANTSPEVGYDQIRAAVEAETDPELRQLMQEQLGLLETGQLDLTGEAGHEVARTIPGTSDGTQQLGETLPGGGLVGPPIDIGTGGQGQGDDLPPEARDRLEKLFQEKGTGDPSRDTQVREEAEQILREYGIDPREIGPGHEGWERGEMPFQEGAFERMSPEALEQMSPEAREQLEQVFGSQETERPETYRESFERESFGTEPRETELQTYEAPTHDYEAPTQEYEAPTHEDEASMNDYEPPAQAQEYQGDDTPEPFTPEQQAPPQP